MDTKLTLKLDNNVIERAKIYAKQKNTSLSQLIETYLNFLTNPGSEREEITPLVKSLSGIIDLPENFDYKKQYKSHILKKYSQ
ncbi:MAG: hypothetical protein HYZ14_06635 [Bacteroidetes bacterium]|nr:hypothetical protein [Bacteroidota bacterium]